MFGLSDPLIIGAYVFSVLSAILCVVYGLANWNKESED